jgi:Na+/melibiose symporter-like transporter
VVDHDETLTGLRREGLYAGATALIAKSVQGLAPAIIVGLHVFGTSREDPMGVILAAPAAGALVLLGILIYRTSPLEL